MEREVQKAKHSTSGTLVQKIKQPQMCNGGWKNHEPQHITEYSSDSFISYQLRSIGTFLLFKMVSLFTLANCRANNQFLDRVFHSNLNDCMTLLRFCFVLGHSTNNQNYNCSLKATLDFLLVDYFKQELSTEEV